MTIRKPILCLDFDGVIHSYTSGWQGAAVIPDPPVPGAIDFIIRALDHFQVAIYSSRSNEPDGRGAMRGWVKRRIANHLTVTENLDALNSERRAATIVREIKWPTAKPPALVTLDDRAVTFTGNWPGLDELRAFQPWNKRSDADRQIDALVDDRQAQLAGFVAEIDAIPNSTAGLTPGEMGLIELLKRIADALR